MKRSLAPFVLLLSACGAVAHQDSRGFELLPESSVGRAAAAALDAFHLAASEADGEAYFELLDSEAIFYGTDASERWTKQEFQEYAAPFFGEGRGWTYEPTERHLYYGTEAIVWFDERLVNAKYGEVRGSGVLIRRSDGWRVAQYNLAFPVPNDLAADLVERVRALESADDAR